MYTDNEGKLIPHESPTEVLEYLRTTAFSNSDSLHEFIKSMAGRVKIQTGVQINPEDTHDKIVAALCQTGLLHPQ